MGTGRAEDTRAIQEWRKWRKNDRKNKAVQRKVSAGKGQRADRKKET